MGHWEENPAAWYEQQMTYCNLCGRLVPKRQWVAEVEGEANTFCSRECEGLYLDYWLPAQAGQSAPPAG